MLKSALLCALSSSMKKDVSIAIASLLLLIGILSDELKIETLYENVRFTVRLQAHLTLMISYHVNI